ncbi:class I SAM-dependent methyltransferase, partial [Klebsiella pneumoniae]|uniref:class I SAM-dependent methyltransferase n=1 Tax=Klebsiella pneumoniae TaxID=573 RepID=UPI003B986C8A
MPHRWVALDGSYSGWPAPGAIDALSGGGARVAVRCDFDALPFPNHSMDLVVLPHALELAQDPHQTLREVERVLVPDGRVAI